MGRANQGGSILSFVIIGGILTVLLIGGAYIVQRASSEPTTENNSPVAVQPSSNADEANKKPSSNEEKTPAPAEPTPAPVTKPAQPAAPQQPAQRQPATSTPATPSAPSVSEKLPAAGPADTFVSVIGAGLLTAISVAYIRSRNLAQQF